MSSSDWRLFSFTRSAQTTFSSVTWNSGERVELPGMTHAKINKEIKTRGNTVPPVSLDQRLIYGPESGSGWSRWVWVGTILSGRAYHPSFHFVQGEFSDLEKFRGLMSAVITDRMWRRTGGSNSRLPERNFWGRLFILYLGNEIGNSHNKKRK